jgi:hypothetical protein
MIPGESLGDELVQVVILKAMPPGHLDIRCR